MPACLAAPAMCVGLPTTALHKMTTLSYNPSPHRLQWARAARLLRSSRSFGCAARLVHGGCCGSARALICGAHLLHCTLVVCWWRRMHWIGSMAWLSCAGAHTTILHLPTHTHARARRCVSALMRGVIWQTCRLKPSMWNPRCGLAVQAALLQLGLLHSPHVFVCKNSLICRLPTSLSSAGQGQSASRQPVQHLPGGRAVHHILPAGNVFRGAGR